MRIFRRRPDPPPVAPWSPVIDFSTARPAVMALAAAPGGTDAQVRRAIADFVRLSGRPPIEQVLDVMRTEPGVRHRPWTWLAEVMREAGRRGDHHLAGAALLWAYYWTTDLVPRGNWGTFLELELEPIPAALRDEIAVLGVSSLNELDDDFVIAGDQTGVIRAASLAAVAADLRSPPGS